MGDFCKKLKLALTGCCREYEVYTSSKDAFQIIAYFEFDAAFEGFAGHFPGKPVLPAVVQLAVVRYLVERGLGQEVIPTSYSHVKFRGMIQPSEQIEVKVTLQKSGAAFTGTFVLSKSGKTTVASGEYEFSSIA